MSSLLPVSAFKATPDLTSYPGLFALLTPISPAAYRDLTRAVDMLLLWPSRKHHRSFLYVGLDRRPLSRVLESRGLPPPDSDFSLTDSEGDEASSGDQMVWDGKFCLTFQNFPADPREGWVLGKGKMEFEAGTGNGGVDLLLGWKCHTVRSKHATLCFDRVTGILKLQPHHRVVVNGRVYNKGDDMVALNEPSTTIRIGLLAYRLEFMQYAQPTLGIIEQAKKDFFATVLRVDEDPIRQTFHLPNANDITVGPWVLHEPVGAGSAAMVSAASRKSAPFQVVAVKDLIRRDRHTRSIANRETEGARLVTQAISSHHWSKHLSKLIDVLCTNPDPSQSSVPDHVLLAFTPLCRGDLFTYVLDKHNKLNQRVPTEVANEIFIQILKGIACLHACGIVHRDIKPANVGVLRLFPKPYAVLIDFGQAVSIVKGGLIAPTPGSGGTVPFLAPEQECAPYGFPVDIWAAGLVGHQLFFGEHPLMPKQGKSLWRGDLNNWMTLKENKKWHEDVVAKLNTVPGSLKNLLGRMLAFDPKERIKAEDAVEHPALKETEEEQATKRTKRRH